MKKLISIFLSVVMLLSMVSVYALEPGVYTVVIKATPEDGKALTDIKSGDKITVTVVLNTTEETSGTSLALQYDPDLFSCPQVIVNNRGKITDFGGISESWYNSYWALDEYDRFTGENFAWAINEVTGRAGYTGTTKGGLMVEKDYAIADLAIFECILTAEKDITETTDIGFTSNSVLTFSLNGRTTTTPLTDSITIGGTSATPTPTPTATPTATPTPTPTPTVAPTAAPEIIDTVTTVNNVTSAAVAEKAFVAFAKIANYTVTDGDEYGILVATGDSVTEADAKAGTAYVAKGNIDGTFGIKIINGGNPDDDPDYVDGFEANSIGYIPYLKIGDKIFYGEFKSLK